MANHPGPIGISLAKADHDALLFIIEATVTGPSKMNQEIFVSFTNNFADWAHQDSNLISTSFNHVKDSRTFSWDTLSILRDLGFAKNTLSCLYGQLKDNADTGSAFFAKVRVLSWYWSNGDQIVFPMNSKNQIYLGNDSMDWVSYWPFISKVPEEPGVYRLAGLTSHTIYTQAHTPCLLVTGQSHFGHFIVNQLIGLRRSSVNDPVISGSTAIIHPPGYSALHFGLLRSYADIRPSQTQCMPPTNGIYEICNCIVPAIGEHYFGLSDTKGAIEQRIFSRDVTKGKMIYNTRGDYACNDRLVSYPDFLASLNKLGFVSVNTTRLSIRDRIELMGDAEVILSDSGSCWLNGLLFSNKASRLMNMIPISILRSVDMLSVCQLCMNLGLFVEGMMLPLDVGQSLGCRNTNCWYDMCIPPSGDILDSLIRN